MSKISEVKLRNAEEYLSSQVPIVPSPCDICGVPTIFHASRITTFLKANDVRQLIKCEVSFRICDAKDGKSVENNIAGICDECLKKCTGTYEGLRV
jgi:hypothetical protein